jgi:hypothetical protein
MVKALVVLYDNGHEAKETFREVMWWIIPNRLAINHASENDERIIKREDNEIMKRKSIVKTEDKFWIHFHSNRIFCKIILREQNPQLSKFDAFVLLCQNLMKVFHYLCFCSKDVQKKVAMQWKWKGLSNVILSLFSQR